MREHDGYVNVATKVAPKNMRWPASAETPVSEVFPAGHIIAGCEASLQTLGIERIDLLQLHVWHDAYLEGGRLAGGTGEAQAAKERSASVGCP